jgi:hypothetical protein
MLKEEDLMNWRSRERREKADGEGRRERKYFLQPRERKEQEK